MSPAKRVYIYYCVQLFNHGIVRFSLIKKPTWCRLYLWFYSTWKVMFKMIQLLFYHYTPHYNQTFHWYIVHFSKYLCYKLLSFVCNSVSKHVLTVFFKETNIFVKFFHTVIKNSKYNKRAVQKTFPGTAMASWAIKFPTQYNDFFLS